jgi:phenylpropionate dioxygenase-like ring-hydroxylating dioxygenase large terminal subunit
VRADATVQSGSSRNGGSSDLLARLGALDEDIREGLVPAWVFGMDPQLYQLELERLFSRVWTFVGHESEIPKPGDYRLRYIGEDPFIFVRSQDGRVRLLFNACRHRGTQICYAEAGQATKFQCPYHGWTYRNTGALVSAPAIKDALGGLDLTAWGLLEAPHLEAYHGFYFASLDPDAPSLAEYMGDAAYYLDTFFGLFDDLEVLGPPQRYRWPVNWKAGFDGFGDDYHLITLHRSFFDIGLIGVPPSAIKLGHHLITGGGHVTTLSIAPSEETAFWGFPPEIRDRYTNENHDDLQQDLARRARLLGGTIFPNFSHLILPLRGSPDREPTTTAEVRLWQPRGPREMEVWMWVLVPRSASQEFREKSQQAVIHTFSSSGMGEQDDGVPPMGINRTGTSVFGRNMKLNYQAGFRVGTADPLSDWPGPGLATAHRYEENSLRYWFRQWRNFLIEEEEYPQLLATPKELD